jgi:hypothetical protein
MSDCVTVACRLPNGIALHLVEPIPGTDIVKRSEWAFWIKGTRVPFGKMPDYPIEHRYAFTRNVPREWWETWLEQNKDSALVRKRLITAYRNRPDLCGYQTVCRKRETRRSPGRATLSLL